MSDSSAEIKRGRLKIEAFAKELRINAIQMTSAGRSSHVGSVLSCADILATLYSSVMTVDPENPKLQSRDRFILSKGHAGAGVYASLAQAGFLDADVLKTHYQDGSILSGHVSHKGVPGVEFSTGSLGHGLGVAAGMALSAKLKNLDHRVYCLLSDGECDEGSNWEAILFAAHHKLHNLVAIVDYNKIQSLRSTMETLDLEPFVDKWKAFGWAVTEVDGHDVEALFESLNIVVSDSSKPNIVIAHTTKGRGVSFMENAVLWHYRSPQDDEFEAALKELKNA